MFTQQKAVRGASSVKVTCLNRRAGHERIWSGTNNSELSERAAGAPRAALSLVCTDALDAAGSKNSSNTHDGEKQRKMGAATEKRGKMFLVC